MGAQIAQPNTAPKKKLLNHSPDKLEELKTVVPVVSETIKNTIMMSKRLLGFLLFMLDDYYS